MKNGPIVIAVVSVLVGAMPAVFCKVLASRATESTVAAAVVHHSGAHTAPVAGTEARPLLANAQ